MLVPKLRFKHEDGTDYPKWEYTRIDEVAEINPKTAVIPETFYYMDLGSISEGIWQEKVLMVKDNSPSRARRLANVGDVFFQSVRPYNMGHYFFTGKFDLPVVASTGFIQLRAKQGNCNSFIYQLLYEDRFNVEVNIRCTGSNYPAINGENFSNIEMLFPCLEEQQKIADFLSTVDEIIAQSEKEVQNLEQQKKAAMQKIFSQEIRFKREDGTDYPEWEEKELGSICNITTGKLNANAMVEGGKYRFYTCASEYYYIDTYAFDTEALLISGNGTNVGYVHYYKGKFNAYQRTYVLDAISEYILYIKAFLDFSLKDRINEEKHSGNVPYIVLSTIAEMNIKIPCFEEQQKIANFLSTFDEAITYAKQELEKWKELKKGLLQQMFV